MRKFGIARPEAVMLSCSLVVLWGIWTPCNALPKMNGAHLATEEECSTTSMSPEKIANPAFTLTLSPKVSKVGNVTVVITLKNLTGRNLADTAMWVNGVDEGFVYDITDEDGKRVQRIPPTVIGGVPIVGADVAPSSILPHSTKTYEVPLSELYQFNRPGRYIIQVCRANDPDVKDNQGNELFISSNAITIYLSE